MRNTRSLLLGVGALATVAAAPLVSAHSFLACAPQEEAAAAQGEDGGAGGDAGPDLSTCPLPVGDRFPPGEDLWSPAVVLRNTPSANDPTGAWFIPTIHMVLLTDGRVLLPGERLRDTADAGYGVGTENYVLTVDTPTADMVIQPPVVPSVHRRPDLDENLFCAGHAPLADGRILLAGGTVPEDYCPDGGPCEVIETGTTYAQTFDPSTNKFTLIEPDMLGGKRWYPTVTRLPDNRALVASGKYRADLEDNLSVELFNPAATPPWTMLSKTEESPRGIALVESYTHVFLLPTPVEADGKSRRLLLMGEGGDMHLFNDDVPFTGTPQQRWVARESRPGLEGVDRALGASSLMLPLRLRNDGRFPNGSVIVTGGAEEVYDKADVYDPYRDRWCPVRTGNMGIGRYQHTVVNLPDGNILFMAGHSNRGQAKGDPRVPQVLNPESGYVWVGSAWPEQRVRGYHSAALLIPDGRVIVGGGLTHKPDPEEVEGKTDEDPSLRYYSPPYLGPLRRGVPRLTIDALPADATMHYKQPYKVRYSNGGIDKAALIAIGAVTHSFDENQRYIELEIQGGKEPNGEVTLVGPEGTALAPQGHYMLFIMHNVDGWQVPAVARIIKVD